MALDVIDVFGDPRIEHYMAQVNGKTYRKLYSVCDTLTTAASVDLETIDYLLAVPKGDYRATIFLVRTAL